LVLILVVPAAGVGVGVVSVPLCVGPWDDDLLLPLLRNIIGRAEYLPSSSVTGIVQVGVVVNIGVSVDVCVGIAVSVRLIVWIVWSWGCIGFGKRVGEGSGGGDVEGHESGGDGGGEADHIVLLGEARKCRR